MILRVHYNFDLKGGAEYDILKLMDTFNQYGGNSWENYLLLIYEEKNRSIKAKLFNEDETLWFNSKIEVKNYLNELIEKLKIKIIHIHSQPSKNITKLILGLNLPVFRSMHEAMIVCPGWSKYWLTEDKPCEISFGPKCLINAYTKKCTRSRNPFNLLRAYENVSYEINTACKRYESIFVYSDYMREEAIKSGISEEKLIKIPSPQPDNFKDIGKKEVDGRILIVFSGRLSKAKGVRYLIEAADQLKKTGYKDFTVLIFGEGPTENHLKELAQDLNLGKNISFFGWVDRTLLNEYYKKAHIAVIPSTYPDNFPNSVAESMLAKLAVIAFDSGGTCEWFKHMESGIKVKNKSTDELFVELKKVISKIDLIHSLGENARNEILENHSLEKTFEVYSKHYSKALKN
jgi:glycosyltransferase involved in cell wall biosynthesis